MGAMTPVQTTTTNAPGAYAFGWLESGTHDVVIPPSSPAPTWTLVAGLGGTTQTRVSAS